MPKSTRFFHLFSILFFATCLFSQDVKVLPISANDLVFRKSDGLLYSIVTHNVPSGTTDVLSIEVATGKTTKIFSLDVYAVQMVFSSDENFLWFASGQKIRRYNFSLQKIDLAFESGHPSLLGRGAFGIMPLPGQPGSLAIHWSGKNGDFYESAISVYDEGVLRPKIAIAPLWMSSATLGNSPDCVYGFDGFTSGHQLRRFSLEADGVTALPETFNFIEGYGAELHFDAGRIYSSTGYVVDVSGTKPLLAATLKLGQSLSELQTIPDQDTGLIYVSIGGQNGFHIETYDKFNFQKISKKSYPEGIGICRKLVDCGKNGSLAVLQNVITILNYCTPQIAQAPPLPQSHYILCPKDSVRLEVPGSFADEQIRWSDLKTGRVRIEKAVGSFSYKIMDAAGCQSSGSPVSNIKLEFAPDKPSIEFESNNKLCTGGYVNLKGFHGNLALLVWSTGDTARQIRVEQPGKYTAHSVSYLGCRSYSDTLQIVAVAEPQPPKPSLSVKNGDIFICSYDTAIIVAPAGFKLYDWNGAYQTENELGDFFQKMVYAVRVQNAEGCWSERSEELQLTYVPALPQPDLLSFDSLLASSSSDWNEWWRNDTLLNGVVGQFVIDKNPGIYKVRLSRDHCFSPFSNTVQHRMSSADEEKNLPIIQLKISPNPVRTTFKMELPEVFLEKFSAKKICLTDPLGRQVWERDFQSDSDWNISEVLTGCYFLQIFGENRRLLAATTMLKI